MDGREGWMGEREGEMYGWRGEIERERGIGAREAWMREGDGAQAMKEREPHVTLEQTDGGRERE